MPNKTSFGFPQLTAKTPLWAKWLFRITILLTTVAAFVIAADPAIADPVKVRVGLYLKGLDILVFGLSKMFGVTVEDEAPQ